MDVTLGVEELSSVPEDVAVLSSDPDVFLNFQPGRREHIVRPYAAVEGYDGLCDLALSDSDVPSLFCSRR